MIDDERPPHRFEYETDAAVMTDVDRGVLAALPTLTTARQWPPVVRICERAVVRPDVVRSCLARLQDHYLVEKGRDSQTFARTARGTFALELGVDPSVGLHAVRAERRSRTALHRAGDRAGSRTGRGADSRLAVHTGRGSLRLGVCLSRSQDEARPCSADCALACSRYSTMDGATTRDLLTLEYDPSSVLDRAEQEQSALAMPQIHDRSEVTPRCP
jgi:hypothetical protein